MSPPRAYASSFRKSVAANIERVASMQRRTMGAQVEIAVARGMAIDGSLSRQK